MTSPVDIGNRALSSIGARATIASLDESSKEAQQINLWYDKRRRQLLRTAPWGFARMTQSLSLLGTIADSTSPYPFLYKYEYPSNCFKVRYILTPPTASLPVGIPLTGDSLFGVAGLSPSRANRFLVASDTDSSGNQRRVILSNVQYAIAVYTGDVISPDMWDDLFEDALTSALAYTIVIPITGNAGMRDDFRRAAETAIASARAVDGNESINSTQHTPDWISARGYASDMPYTNSTWGMWNVSYEDMAWGS
jgi:hypothetical protein